jgi:ADP-ribose pyrophosphatase YjhB (NUDIX family)
MGHTMTTQSIESTTESAIAPTTPITVPRRYPGAPLVGVGVAIYNPQGQLLLIQRGRPPGKGTWGLPGGLLDLGEKVVAAAEREVMEELGVTVAVGNLVTTFESIYRDAEGKVEYHYVVLEYWAHYLGGTPVAQDDAAAVAWVDEADLGNYGLTRRQLEVLKETFAAWRDAPPPHLHTTQTL